MINVIVMQTSTKKRTDRKFNKYAKVRVRRYRISFGNISHDNPKISSKSK